MAHIERKVYRFRHEEENIDVYSPEAGNWVPFRNHVFETDSKEMAEWIALLRNPRITLDKGVEPVGTAINPLMDHAPAEGNERYVPETLPADAGSGTLDVDPADNPAVDMDDPQRQASPANAPTGSPNDSGPERVRVAGEDKQVGEAKDKGEQVPDRPVQPKAAAKAPAKDSKK